MQEVPIIQKIYDLYREVYLAVEKMPKKDRFSLGQKIEQINLDLIELLIGAGSNKDKKLLYLGKAAIKLDLLKMLIRLAEEVKAIPTKKYLHLQEILQEIGKMLGGWIRSTKAPN